MPDRPDAWTNPQPTSSISPHTPENISTRNDLSSAHSARGPQYEDLPPSYDFALSDTHSSGTATNASRIEAPPASGNRRPIEAQVWECSTRGENTGAWQEHQEAPVHEGHASIESAIGSQDVPVHLAGDSAPSSFSAITRSTSAIQDPPYPPSDPQSRVMTGHSQVRQTRAQSEAHGSGPLDPRHGSSSGREGLEERGRQRRGSRSTQDPATLGQSMGRRGEEIGRRMGNWGEQIGRQARAMAKQFGQRTEQCATAYGAGGGGYNPPVRPRLPARSSIAEPTDLPRYDHPPSYEASVDAPG